MAKYAISPEGAEAMQQLAYNISSAADGIKQATQQLKTQILSYMDDLGVFGLDIWAMTLQIDGIMEDKQESIMKLSEIAKSKADVILSLTGLSGMDAGGSSFNPGNPNSSGFANLEMGRMQNGMQVVKGESFDQYYANYYDSENLEFESAGNQILVETVRPSQIEGVHLGDGEASNPDDFWSMHASSKEFFMETASHIPEVRSALDSGKSLDELINDPVLGKCASVYFNPENIPRVEKWDGFYTFDGDGRHRILAARELGCEIPVRITGMRRHK